MKNKLIQDLFNSTVTLLKAVDTLGIVEGLEDTQEYLNWKDEINAISVDRDRKTPIPN